MQDEPTPTELIKAVADFLRQRYRADDQRT